MNSPSDDHIERLKGKLYSPGSPDVINKHVRPLEPKDSKIENTWKSEVEPEEKKDMIFEINQKPKKSFLPWIFAAVAFLFFAGSSIFAWYYIVNRAGVTSNVGVYVTGPVSVAGGTEITLEISIVNQNKFPLELVDLVIDYPPGTKDAKDISKDLEILREGLGTIDSGEKVTRKVQIILFGSEREKKTIKARAEYHIPNSNASYENEKVVDILLETGPVEFVLDVLKEATINQEVELLLRIRSNTKSNLENILVKAEYPAGFSFTSSLPKPSSGNNIWDIAKLPPESTTTIRIKGVFTGEANVDRYFKFEGGVKDKLNPTKIAGIFASSLEAVRLVSPFIGAKLVMDNQNSEGEVVSTPGKNLSGSIEWKNNLDVPITDMVIEARILGEALDRRSVNAFSGFYRSSDNKITWNGNTNEELVRIDPDKSGNVNFSFSTIPFSSETSLIKNQEVMIDISVSAKRPGESNVPEEIKSTIVQSVKLESEPRLNSRAVYYVGAFPNTGPLPPKVEEHTTYTVIWSLTNTANDLGNVTVTGSLPPYVSWVGKTAPTSERIIYDDKTGKVTWNAGSVPSGVGYTRASREVAFQVDLMPSANQVGETPILIKDQILRAEDTFTKTSIEDNTNSNVNTRISTDPNYSTELERVVE